MGVHLKFMYEAPYQTTTDRIILNWAMQSQTKACIAKLSYVDKTA